MKVILSSMPKGGTKTMACALRMLGFTVYDFEEQFWYLGKGLQEAMDTGYTTEQFYDLLKDVDAITDVPCVTFWEEILRAFPDAKVIHTERKDEDEWAKSLEKQIDSVKDQKLLRFLMYFIPTGKRFQNFFRSSARCQFSIPAFSPWTPVASNPTLQKLRYREHNARVKQAVPKDQLLEYEFVDGWEPLCKFLNVPVPDKAFPHRNKGGEITEEIIAKSLMFDQIKKEIIVLVSTVTLVVAGLIYYFFF